MKTATRLTITQSKLVNSMFENNNISNYSIILRKITAFFLVLILALGFSLSVKAETSNSLIRTESTSPTSEGRNYSVYSAEIANVSSAKSAIEIQADSFTANTSGCVPSAYDLADGARSVVWESGKGTLTYNISVPKTARYNLALTYATLEGNGVDISVGLNVDGEYPFEETKKLLFPRMWKNTTNEWKTNESGDEISPEQEEYLGSVTNLAKDSEGLALKPYEFMLTEGNHTLAIEALGEPFVLIKITLLPLDESPSYADAKPSDKELSSDFEADSIFIQAEKADLKTSSSIIPKYDNSEVTLTPSSATEVKLNYLGGSWSSPNQEVNWSFKVKKSGYYKIGFYFKQDQVINSETYRWLKIDGKTPYKEAESISFSYSTKWQFKEFANENGEVCLIYLDAGEHTLSMEATLGDIAPYYEKLSAITESLGNMYSEIVWITGDTPDANRDYELFKAIPNFEETLKSNMEALNDLADELSALSGKRSNQYIASFNNMSRVLRLMIERPYIAHQYLSDYYSNYCTVTAWLNEMASMPLSLDEIQIVPFNNEFDEKKTNIFKRLIFGIRRFANSYVSDYNSVSNDENTSSLRLWVNIGRDQAQALKNMIHDSFTEEYGINVKVELVNATLIQGILSGNAPDMAIQLSRADPVNLGFRNALYDLTQFEDFDEVLGRFQDGAELPYCYDGKCYALPDTQSFYVMFYRSDIFEQFNLKVPNTWEEFIQTAITIQRKNLQVYIPYTRITSSGMVNTGIGGLNLLPTLLMQNGISIYNEDKNASVLDSPEAISIFEKWTEFYTDYKLVKEADFFNRFRAGTIPLGIVPYTTAFTIQQTAPELDGRWAMTRVPSADGINHIVAGGGTGCSILDNTKNPDEAWTFLKWWTSADTQVRYSKNIESILGLVGRVPSSNVEALKAYSWASEYKTVVLKQWAEVKEVPEIPGSYYLTRAVDQAFWAVVNGESNSVDSVTKWNEIANSEISRKIKEYQALKER